MITVISNKGKAKLHVNGTMIEVMADLGVAIKSMYDMFRDEGEDVYNLFKEVMYPEGGMPDWLAEKDTDIDALESLEQIVEDYLNASLEE